MSLLITEGLGEEGDVIPGPTVDPPHMYKALVLRPKMIYGGGVSLALGSTKAVFVVVFFLSRAAVKGVGRKVWQRLLK